MKNNYPPGNYCYFCGDKLLIIPNRLHRVPWCFVRDRDTNRLEGYCCRACAGLDDPPEKQHC